MSTNARKSTASFRSREASADVGDSIQNAWTAAKEAIRTKNGHYFVFAVQFLLSLLSILYLKGVIKLAYYSMFYRLSIPEENRTKYCFLVSLACIFFGAVLLFTRRQIVTRVCIMASMPFYLPIIMFNYKHLVLLVPLGIMVVITYLASGTKEGPKTILGAVFLMMYVIGVFVFLTVQNILQPATEETVIERDITPLGSYRYSVVQVLDQGDGNTYVAVEPNDVDVEYKNSKWFAKGFRQEIYRERPLQKGFKVEWSTQTRAEITKELITTNPSTVFVLNADQMRTLGLNAGFAKDYEIKSLSRRQRHKLGYASNGDDIDKRIAPFLHVQLVDPDFVVSLDFNKMVEIGLNPTYEQRLSRMTDEQLAMLGVPEENEVLKVGKKVVFREYVAVLERRFAPENRDLSSFLQTDEEPEVHPEGVEIPVKETTTVSSETTTGTSASSETTTETTAAQVVW